MSATTPSTRETRPPSQPSRDRLVLQVENVVLVGRRLLALEIFEVQNAATTPSSPLRSTPQPSTPSSTPLSSARASGFRVAARDEVENEYSLFVTLQKAEYLYRAAYPVEAAANEDTSSEAMANGILAHLSIIGNRQRGVGKLVCREPEPHVEKKSRVVPVSTPPHKQKNPHLPSKRQDQRAVRVQKTSKRAMEAVAQAMRRPDSDLSGDDESAGSEVESNKPERKNSEASLLHRMAVADSKTMWKAELETNYEESDHTSFVLDDDTESNFLKNQQYALPPGLSPVKRALPERKTKHKDLEVRRQKGRHQRILVTQAVQEAPSSALLDSIPAQNPYSVVIEETEQDASSDASRRSSGVTVSSTEKPITQPRASSAPRSCVVVGNAYSLKNLYESETSEPEQFLRRRTLDAHRSVLPTDQWQDDIFGMGIEITDERPSLITPPNRLDALLSTARHVMTVNAVGSTLQRSTSNVKQVSEKEHSRISTSPTLSLYSAVRGASHSGSALQSPKLQKPSNDYPEAMQLENKGKLLLGQAREIVCDPDRGQRALNQPPVQDFLAAAEPVVTTPMASTHEDDITPEKEVSAPPSDPEIVLCPSSNLITDVNKAFSAEETETSKEWVSDLAAAAGPRSPQCFEEVLRANEKTSLPTVDGTIADTGIMKSNPNEVSKDVAEQDVDSPPTSRQACWEESTATISSEVLDEKTYDSTGGDVLLVMKGAVPEIVCGLEPSPLEQGPSEAIVTEANNSAEEQHAELHVVADNFIVDGGDYYNRNGDEEVSGDLVRETLVVQEGIGSINTVLQRQDTNENATPDGIDATNDLSIVDEVVHQTDPTGELEQSCEKDDKVSDANSGESMQSGAISTSEDTLHIHASPGIDGNAWRVAATVQEPTGSSSEVDVDSTEQIQDRKVITEKSIYPGEATEKQDSNSKRVNRNHKNRAQMPVVNETGHSEVVNATICFGKDTFDEDIVNDESISKRELDADKFSCDVLVPDDTSSQPMQPHQTPSLDTERKNEDVMVLVEEDEKGEEPSSRQNESVQTVVEEADSISFHKTIVGLPQTPTYDEENYTEQQNAGQNILSSRTDTVAATSGQTYTRTLSRTQDYWFWLGSAHLDIFMRHRKYLPVARFHLSKSIWAFTSAFAYMESLADPMRLLRYAIGLFWHKGDGNLEKTRDICHELFSRFVSFCDKDLPNVLFLQFQVFHRLKFYVDAIECMNKIVGLHERLSQQVVSSLSSTNAIAHFSVYDAADYRLMLMQCQQASGDYVSAALSLAAVLKLKGVQQDTTLRDEEYFDLWCSLAEKSFHHEDYALALEYYAIALNFAKQSQVLAAIHYNLGLCFQSLGEDNKCVTEYKRARTANRHVAPLVSLAEISIPYDERFALLLQKSVAQVIEEVRVELYGRAVKRLQRVFRSRRNVNIGVDSASSDSPLTKMPSLSKRRLSIAAARNPPALVKLEDTAEKTGVHEEASSQQNPAAVGDNQVARLEDSTLDFVERRHEFFLARKQIAIEEMIELLTNTQYRGRETSPTFQPKAQLKPGMQLRSGMLSPEKDRLDVRRKQSMEAFRQLGYVSSTMPWIEFWEKLLTLVPQLYESRQALYGSIARIRGRLPLVTDEVAFCALAESIGNVHEAAEKLHDALYERELTYVCAVVEVSKQLERDFPLESTQLPVKAPHVSLPTISSPRADYSSAHSPVEEASRRIVLPPYSPIRAKTESISKPKKHLRMNQMLNLHFQEHVQQQEAAIAITEATGGFVQRHRRMEKLMVLQDFRQANDVLLRSQLAFGSEKAVT
ncbi:hypothetical protein PRNP1_002365 [Phytophthora ramorum]